METVYRVFKKDGHLRLDLQTNFIQYIDLVFIQLMLLYLLWQSQYQALWILDVIVNKTSEKAVLEQEQSG